MHECQGERTNHRGSEEAVKSRRRDLPGETFRKGSNHRVTDERDWQASYRRASTRPRLGSRGEVEVVSSLLNIVAASATSLQCGHGSITVETRRKSQRWVRPEEELQCGHGSITVETAGHARASRRG